MITTVRSVCGAPGASWTTYTLARFWPSQALIVEADLWSSFFLTNVFGGRLEAKVGLTTLATLNSSASGFSIDDVRAQMVPAIGGGIPVLPGVLSSAKAPGLGALWAPLARVLKAISAEGVGVFIDLGRFDEKTDVRKELSVIADKHVLVAGSSLADVAALKGQRDYFNPITHKVALTSKDDPYSASEIESSLSLDVFDIQTMPAYLKTVDPKQLDSRGKAQKYGAKVKTLVDALAGGDLA